MVKPEIAFVLSENGVELFCSLPDHNEGSMIPMAKRSPSMNAMVKDMLKGKSGKAKYIQDWNGHESSEEHENHAAYQKVDLGNTFWSIAVSVSEDEVLAINRGFILKLVIIVTVLGLLLLVITFIYVRYRNKTIEYLKLSEEKHRIVTEQTGQLIYEYNPHTDEITWGGAIEELSGYTAEEFHKISYKESLELIHPDDRGEQLKKISRAKKNQTNYRGEYRVRVKNGSYIYVQNNAGFLLDREKNRIRVFGAIRNITEQKDAELTLLKYQEGFGRISKSKNCRT